MLRSIPRRCPGKASSAGYGPFSAVAKARLAREKQQQQQQQQQQLSSSQSPGAAAGKLDVMSNIGLGNNLFLRLSLAALPHPSQVQAMNYQSAEWRHAMVQLYRTILRLHNKTVAVSVDRSRTAGAAEAVAAVTGVDAAAADAARRRRVHAAEERFLNGNSKEGRSALAEQQQQQRRGGCPEDAEPKTPEDYLLKYLLTPAQREFGNRFVQDEFTRNRDADAVSGLIFYESWYQYVLQLASGVTAKDMTEEEKRLLTPEQKEKLEELRGAFTSLKAQQEPGFML